MCLVDQSIDERKEFESMRDLRRQFLKGIPSGEREKKKSQKEGRRASWQLVCLGCYNKRPYTLWIINKKYLFSPFWRLEVLRSGFQHGLVKARFQALFFFYPYVLGDSKELSQVSFMRALTHVWRLHPHDLITFQRPHFLIPSPWGLRF